VNDRHGGAIVRFLNRFSLIKEVFANDRPGRCDRSLPQNALHTLSEPQS
jgi:hypothetical protein